MFLYNDSVIKMFKVYVPNNSYSALHDLPDMPLIKCTNDSGCCWVPNSISDFFKALKVVFIILNT